MMREPKLTLGPDLVKLIAEIDEFKGRWEALKTLSPDRLTALRKVATIESIGSSTRIEGAKLSDAEIESLLAWASKAIEEEAHHPLLIIAVFVVAFLAIHPFQDGNGRLSRILTTLLLLCAGYAYVPYASLERVIEDNKDLYHRALRRTQTTLKSDRPDWEPWIGFFLRCMKKQKDGLVLRLERERTGASDVDAELPEISVQILRLLHAHGRQTIAQLEIGTRANRNTIKVRLRELVAQKRIRQHGKARATWYSL
jgi:Fic family protein